MIQLTRLGGEAFILNAELIQYVETAGDTFVTLTTGQRLIVAQSMDEVLRRAVVYQQAKHLLPPPRATEPLAAEGRPTRAGSVAAKEASQME